MKNIDVVAAVIEHNGKYFATQRGYGDYKGWLDKEHLQSVNWLPADREVVDKLLS